MTDETRIKVLHIITRLDAGGSATNTMETVARLDRKRYVCRLLTGKTHDPQGHIKNRLGQLDVSCTFIDELRRNIHPLFDGIAFIKLYRSIKEGRYDIVHTHSSKAGILGRFAANIAGVKIIIHTPHGHVFHGYFNKWVSRIFMAIERLAAKVTDKIITLTDIGKNDHVRLRIAAEDKFVTIPSGIDVEYFRAAGAGQGRSLREQYGLTDDHYVFGSVSRLDPIKGNDYLVRAFSRIAAQYPLARLFLVGDGSQKEQLQRLCDRLAVRERVQFAGYQANASDYFCMMDCFVLASLNEGMGRSLLEAMVCRKPVIATNTGGIPEIIEHGKQGLLVPPGADDELADAMEAIMTHPQEASNYGQKGYEKVDRFYSLASMVESIDKLYQELLKG